MATGPLHVYPMDGEPLTPNHSAEGEQVSTCSPDNVGCNQSCSSGYPCASPITSGPAHIDDESIVMDVVREMCRKEATVYHHPFSYYVKHYHAEQQQDDTSFSNSRRKKNLVSMDSWRKSLIQWMYQVADFSYVRQETVGVAVCFLDVAISKIIVRAMNRNQKRNNCVHFSLDDYKVSFQLAAATALELAIKTHDCKMIKLQDLVILGRKAFTERDIVRMEVQIIEACRWYLHPPSIYCYMHQYQSLLFDILRQDDSSRSSKCHRADDMEESTKSTISKLVNMITEIILPEAEYKSYPPSIVAYAIILVAMAFVKPSIISAQQRQRLSGRISLALMPEGDTEQDSQQEDQQFLLLQTIHQIQASCQSSTHLDLARILRDMVILELSIDGKPSSTSSSSLVCLTMDDFMTTGPKTPPKGMSSRHSFSIVHSKMSDPESPISVMDNSSQLLLLKHLRNS